MEDFFLSFFNVESARQCELVRLHQRGGVVVVVVVMEGPGGGGVRGLSSPSASSLKCSRLVTLKKFFFSSPPLLFSPLLSLSVFLSLSPSASDVRRAARFRTG